MFECEIFEKHPKSIQKTLSRFEVLNLHSFTAPEKEGEEEGCSGTIEGQEGGRAKEGR